MKVSYLSAPRLDTKQNKYQSCQHPAKRKFYVFRPFSEEVRRRKQELDTGICHIFIQTCNVSLKKKKVRYAKDACGENKVETTDLEGEQNLKPRPSKCMVYDSN